MKFFEDYEVGEVIPLGSRAITTEEILAFARQFDPQVFHTDPDDARTHALGGLLASGWHTSAIYMSLAVPAFLGRAAVLTSPGVDELRWRAPVRGGDTLTGEAVICGLRPSKSRPDRGIIQTDSRLWNQDRVDVLTLRTTVFVLKKASGD